MQDRVPLYPGRVKMTPVTGQANTFDMVRADDPTQAGTPLNKATFLKDATAALFGLGTGSVPDDVLAELGKYKQYWWRRRTPAGERYVVKETNVDVNVRFTNGSSPQTIKIAQSYTLDANTGGIYLNSPVDYTVSGAYSAADNKNRANDIVAKAPCYIMGLHQNPAAIFYLPEGSNVVQSESSQFVDATIWASQSTLDPYNFLLITNAGTAPKAKVISAEKVKVPASDWQYVQSSSRSAYPDSGTSGGYEYEYLGIPFDNAVNAPKIVTGSYTGTGEYNSIHPNSLTFPGTPLFLAVGGANNFHFWAVRGDDASGATRGSNGPVWVTLSWDENGNTVSWFNTTSAEYQLNVANRVYTYIAIC